MNDADIVVFVEVRYRADTRYGGALHSIDEHKRRRLIATAEHYLQRHAALHDRACRFDVVTVAPGSPDAKIHWIKDAFQA